MFDKLFRRLFGRETFEHDTNPSPFDIPIPEGTDPKMWERTRSPIRNRKKYTPEQIEADADRYKKEMREKMASISKFDRERALSVGCKSFIWRAVKDAGTCTECAANDGRRFSYEKPPKIGYPGDHDCPTGWCRCFAEPIIPK